MDSSAFFQ